MKPDELYVRKKQRNIGNQTLKLKRQQINVKCRLCGVLRHNSATCLSNLDNLTVNMNSTVTIEVFGEKKAIDKAMTKLMVRKKTNATPKSAAGGSASGKNYKYIQFIAEVTKKTDTTPKSTARGSVTKQTDSVNKSTARGSGSVKIHNVSNVEGTSQPTTPLTLRPLVLPPKSTAGVQIGADEIPSQLNQVTTMTSYQQPHMLGPSMYQQLQMTKSGMNQRRARTQSVLIVFD
ncbi:hypothetical protein Pfo_021905 [Paulownia fortunei]|nr:hypothetical protein Pfo_021905 [Paulownia fortunei]